RLAVEGVGERGGWVRSNGSQRDQAKRPAPFGEKFGITGFLRGQPTPPAAWKFNHVVASAASVTLPGHFLTINLAVAGLLLVFRVPKEVVSDVPDSARPESACLLDGDGAEPILAPEYLVQQTPYAVDVLVADLHEDATALRQKVPRSC